MRPLGRFEALVCLQVAIKHILVLQANLTISCAFERDE